MASKPDFIDFLRKPRAMPTRRATKTMLVIALVAAAIAVMAYPRTQSPFTQVPVQGQAALPNAIAR